MRGGFLGAGGETVGREIASRLGVALQRDKDVGQGTGEQFRVKEVVRFLKGPVLRRCNGFGLGGTAFHWVALVIVFVSYDLVARHGGETCRAGRYCATPGVELYLKAGRTPFDVNSVFLKTGKPFHSATRRRRFLLSVSFSVNA